MLSALTLSQLFTLFALVCAVTTTVVARRHWKVDAWLRRLFLGLNVCAVAAVLITWTTRLSFISPLACLMLASVALPALSFRRPHAKDKTLS